MSWGDVSARLERGVRERRAEMRSAIEIASRSVATVVVAALVLTAGVASAASITTTSTSTTSTSTTTAGSATTLPSVKSDNISVNLPSSVSSVRAVKWLRKLITSREVALTTAQTKVDALKTLSAAERAQLTGIVTAPMSVLSATALSITTGENVAKVETQATAIVALQVFNVTLVQVSDLERIDALLSKIASTSTQLNAAAAAIAISNQTARTIATERALDRTAQTILVRMTSALGQADRLLLGLATAPLSTVPSTLGSVQSTITTETTQLKRAQTDLEQVVNKLAGRKSAR